MDQQREKTTSAALEQVGAVLTGHFVGTSWKHLSAYVVKDLATQYPQVASILCEMLAASYARDEIDVVVSPAVGAIALSQWMASHLTLKQGSDRPPVQAMYAEPDDLTLLSLGKNDAPVTIILPNQVRRLVMPLEKVILRRPEFVLKRGFDLRIKGLRALVAEDIVTTGGTARASNAAVRRAGAIVVGTVALAANVEVTAEMCDTPRLEVGMRIKRETYTAEDCMAHGMCSRGVPIDTRYGHGAEFLKQQRMGRGA